MVLSDIIYIAISFVMTTVKKIGGLSFFPAIFLMTAIITSSSTGVVGIVFSQSASNQTVEEMNQTAAELNQTLPESMNQTAAQMNQSAAQMGNQTTTNQTSMSKLTITDVEDIRKSLEDVRKSLADGNAVDALKTVNEIDDKLLVSLGDNPPSMLEKSTDNDDDDN
jgi:type VI protein secretion system component VasK